MRETYHDCQGANEFGKQGVVNFFDFVVSQDVSDLLSHPVLHLWMYAKKHEGEGEGMCCGIMPCEVEDEKVAEYLIPGNEFVVHGRTH
jgi:hypothetical protein